MAVTPNVIAGYGKNLYEKDTKGKYATNKFKLEVRIPKGDEAGEAWLEKLRKLIKAAGGKNNPIKDGDEYKGDNETRAATVKGHWTLTFKSQHKPKVVDAHKQTLPKEVAEVMGGDIVRILYNAKEYDGMGGGLTLYLNAVQLVKKNAGQANIDEFEDVEDGFTADDRGVTGGDEDDDDADF